MTTTYIIRDKETGTEIEEVTTLAEAEQIVAEYEETDRAEGTYTPEFYEIVEK